MPCLFVFRDILGAVYYESNICLPLVGIKSPLTLELDILELSGGHRELGEGAVAVVSHPDV